MTIAEIGKLLKTQDNRITEHPIFMVQEKSGRGAWQNVQPCFTEVGAEAYIRANRHNHGKLRIFVESAYRNAEWQAIRQWLMEAADA